MTFDYLISHISSLDLDKTFKKNTDPYSRHSVTLKQPIEDLVFMSLEMYETHERDGYSSCIRFTFFDNVICEGRAAMNGMNKAKEDLIKKLNNLKSFMEYVS